MGLESFTNSFTNSMANKSNGKISTQAPLVCLLISSLKNCPTSLYSYTNGHMHEGKSSYSLDVQREGLITPKATYG